jgi:hypothetical protein
MKSLINKRKKRFYYFLRGYFYFFLIMFAISLIDYKSGRAGTGGRSSVPYNRPKPYTWEYVFDHLPDIMVFSLGSALLLTLTLPPPKDE